MSEQGYTCEGCGEQKTERFSAMVDHEVCSARCAGKVLAGHSAKKLKKRKPKDTALDVLHRAVPPSPTPIGFVIPAQDTPKETSSPGWGEVPFERNVYRAFEVTILVKVHEGGSWRVFGNMKNTLAYTDPRLGLLLRPDLSGVRSTFSDFPEAVKIAKVRPSNRHKGITETKNEPKPARTPKPKVVREPVTVEGATYGNVCADPGSKRFWLVESMLKGGDSKEIVKRAGKLAKEAGIFEEEDFSTMASNTSSIRNMYSWLKNKWNEKGVKGRVTETNGLFHAEVLGR